MQTWVTPTESTKRCKQQQTITKITILMGGINDPQMVGSLLGCHEK
jgi:hypothetical protein